MWLILGNLFIWGSFSPILVVKVLLDIRKLMVSYCFMGFYSLYILVYGNKDLFLFCSILNRNHYLIALTFISLYYQSDLPANTARHCSFFDKLFLVHDAL